MRKSTVLWGIVAFILALLTFGISLSRGWEIHSMERSLALSALVATMVAICALIWMYYQRKAAGIPETDERIDKINLYAFSYSYRVGIVFMIVLTWAAIFFKNAAVFYSLCASVFVMTGSFLGFRWILDMKGDVR
jgi:hypothetical protein